jgi:riboflavin synthase
VVSKDARIGDSIAVNGCCLTVAESQADILGFDVLAETSRRTNLGSLASGAPVNLERALSAHARLGGHFVQGHVDASCPILSFKKVGADHRLEITLPREFARYVAFKGSIAVDGISLTVAEVHDASFVLWIIPHTLAFTNLRAAKPGAHVNLEFDLLAKYVERLLASR